MANPGADNQLIRPYDGHQYFTQPDKYEMIIEDTYDDARYLRALIKQFISHVEFFHSNWIARIAAMNHPNTNTIWANKKFTRILETEKDYLESLIEIMRTIIKRFYEQHDLQRAGYNYLNACRRQEYMLYLVLNCLADLRVFSDHWNVGNIDRATFVNCNHYTGIHNQYKTDSWENMLVTVQINEDLWFRDTETIRWKLPVHFVHVSDRLSPNQTMTVVDMRRNLERYAMYLCCMVTYPGAHKLYFTAQTNLDAVAVLESKDLVPKKWQPLAQFANGNPISTCGYPNYPNLWPSNFKALPKDGSKPMSMFDWYEVIRQDRVQDLVYLCMPSDLNRRKRQFSRML